MELAAAQNCEHDQRQDGGAGACSQPMLDCPRRRRRGHPRLECRDRAVQPVAALWQRLDQCAIALVAAGVAQLAAQFVDAACQGVVGNDRICPELLVQFLARDDLAGVLRQQQQDAHDLGVELLAGAGPRNLSGKRFDAQQVELEAALKGMPEVISCRRVHRVPANRAPRTT
jgi:hypothetical protein